MVYLRVFFLLLFVLPAVASAAEPIRIQAASRISAVTVYPDRAMTTRNATLSLKRGSYVAVFEGLPVLVEDKSIRVTGKGSAVATILGVKVNRAFAEQVPEKRARELDKEILAVTRKIAGLDARKEALAAQKKFIDSIKVAWGDRISKELAVGRPTSAELNEALTFVGNGITRVEQQTREIDEEKQQLKDKADALKRQRQEAIGSGRKEAKTVEVGLDVSREGTLDLVLAGVTPQASWEPSYDARLAPDGKSVELVFNALIRQRTGEDWRHVTLSLSTARPSLGGAPPNLVPWRVSLIRPPMSRPESPMAERSYAAPAMQARKDKGAFEHEDVLKTEAAYENAEMAEERNSISFTIPRSVDVPSDGTQHGSVIASERLPLSLEFLTVPKQSPNVYLRSEVVNRAAYPLLPGQVTIFTGGNYVGSSRLKKIAAGEKFDLFFGSDDQVTVKREEVKSHKEAGVFGKNRMEYRCRIELQNFRKETQTVTVRDQLPVAGDAEITVVLDEPNIKPAETDRDGTLTWKLPVGPGEKKVITFGILVEYPKERRASGL